MDVTELQWITYLSLVALAIVTYLYIRQRNENNQRTQSLRSQDEYYSVVTKPTGFMSKSYPGPDPNLPTFSPQEAFQRKNPGEMNASQINQRDLRDRPTFGGGNVSHFNVPATDKSTDKSFDEYRRYTPYEPSQEISTSRASFKQDQNDRSKPHWSKIETSITQISTQQDPYDANKDILYAQTQPQVSQVEEEQPTGDKWNNTRTLDAPDLENEYKVFRDFKLREGRGFHDEPKRDESPIRANSKKLSGLDRVGHSPDSPFKMFGSPAIGTNSKKKVSTNQATKQHQNLFSKKDSFTRTQEALNQKNKPPVRTVPHNQRSAKVLADQRNERKAKLNQVFIDNNSEDEMHVEHEKDPSMKNKRPATDTRSFDRYEKETNNKKVLKTNDQQAKAKPFERKNVPLRGNYQPEGHSKKEQKPSFNQQSSVDLSYMSEYSANPSLKKYVQMKTRQDETTRVSKPSTPITNTKGMNVEKSPRQATSPRVEKGSYRAPSSLARKEDTPASKKLSSNGSHAALKSEVKQEKTVGTTQPKSDNEDNKGLFGNNNGNKLTSLPKETNIKPEGAKISSLIGGSSLFTQPKTEATPTLGDEEKKTSKLNETEKAQQPSMGQGNAFNLFKTIRPGAFGASKESEDQPSSKKNEEEPQKQASLFSNPKSDQKQDNEKPQEQPKTELKGLFPSSGGGLFANSQDKKPESSAGTGLFGSKETKETEQKQPSSAFSSLTATAKSNEKEDDKPKTGLFGSLTTPASGGLFGNLTSEPKKDLNQSSVPSLFGNTNKDTQKKDDPLSAYSKQPEAADDKPQGLFAGSNTSFGSLFKNAGESSGGGSLFGGLANKDGKSTGGGLFSNLNK